MATPRQVEILRLVANALSNAEIAERLYISVRTVNTHMRLLYEEFCPDQPPKSHIKRLALIHAAHKAGLI